jgi:hypothetical protein
MPRRLLVRIAIVLGALALTGYWLQAFTALGQGQLFAYVTYWNAPVGTWTLVIALVFLTSAWAWATWRYWNWKGHKAAND